VKLSREVRIGLIVTAATALLIYGFNFLKGKNIFSKRFKFYAVYSRIDGLVESNPVQINGYTVGRVSDIHFLPGNSGKIIIEMALNEDELKLPSNTVARVISSDLLGSKAVQLILGDAPTPAVSGDTLLADVQASLGDEVNKQVQPIKAKAEKLISSIDSVLVVIQAIFNEKSQGELIQSFESINLAIKSLKKTSYRVDTLIAEQRIRLSRITSNVESITGNFKNNNDKVTKILTNFSTISDSLVKANIAQTVMNANKSLKETADILEKIKRGEGSLGLLVNNDSLYNNLNNASKDLDALFVDMKEHPKRYVHFSVFGRKDRQKKAPDKTP
jgi:phospholipid/cholesterol/gamma-HCH transport system substrate-binding protein